MNRKFSTCLFIALALLMFRCSNDPQPGGGDSLVAKTDSINKDSVSVATLDSTILLSFPSGSKYKGPDLSDSLAKEVLYAWFKSQGYYTYEEYYYTETPRPYNEMHPDTVIDFDTTFMADLNGDNFSDAIIIYWKSEAYENGHCVQPDKAVIVSTNTGYKIMYEKFIPTNYWIDSVQNINGQVILFGYDYQCASHRVMRNLRLRIR